MRIFLTGANGHVGAPLLQWLLRQGHDLTLLMRPPVFGQGAGGILPPSGCRIIYGSLGNLASAQAAVNEAHAVIHLASPRSNDRDVVLADDISGTGQLLDIWRKGPFIYASSQTVYGIPRGDLDEEIGLSPSCWYDVAKIANEVQLTEAARDPIKPGISLRMALLFSSRPNDHAPQYLPALVAAVARRKAFIFRDEASLDQAGTSYIGDHDLARAIGDALTLKASGPYNVAAEFVNWRQLLDCIGVQLGRPVIYRVGRDQPENEDEIRLPQSRSFLPCGKFVTSTGFSPSQSLDSIVATAIRHTLKS